MATPRRIISRSDFARLLGVGRSAVSKACRPGKRLRPACFKGGIDELHAAAQAWLAERRPPPEAPAEASPADVAPEDEPIVGDLGELGRLRLDELNEQHGNVRELRGFIRARKDLEEARKAQMHRLKTQSRLIPVRGVELMFAHLDTAFRLLLTDVPRALATRLAPSDMVSATATARDLVSQHLRRARDAVAEAMASNDPLAPIPVPKEPIPFTGADAPYSEDP